MTMGPDYQPTLYNDVVGKRHNVTNNDKIEPQWFDRDVRQQTMLKLLNTHLNKGGTRESFEAWCLTPEGESHIKLTLKHALTDLQRAYHFRKPPQEGEKYSHLKSDDILWPTSQAFGSSDDEFASSSIFDTIATPSSDIDEFQRMMDARDELRDLYVNGTEDEREAIEILSQWLVLKDQGESGSELRKRLGVLRKRIQATGKTWNLSPTML
jgi:hypothetical protein